MVFGAFELTGFGLHPAVLCGSDARLGGDEMVGCLGIEPFRLVRHSRGVAAAAHSLTGAALGQALVDFHRQAQLGEFAWNAQ